MHRRWEPIGITERNTRAERTPADHNASLRPTDPFNARAHLVDKRSDGRRSNASRSAVSIKVHEEDVTAVLISHPSGGFEPGARVLHPSVKEHDATARSPGREAIFTAQNEERAGLRTLFCGHRLGFRAS
jgi:hypothetical protein